MLKKKIEISTTVDNYQQYEDLTGKQQENKNSIKNIYYNI